MVNTCTYNITNCVQEIDQHRLATLRPEGLGGRVDTGMCPGDRLNYCSVIRKENDATSKVLS